MGSLGRVWFPEVEPGEGPGLSPSQGPPPVHLPTFPQACSAEPLPSQATVAPFLWPGPFLLCPPPPEPGRGCPCLCPSPARALLGFLSAGPSLGRIYSVHYCPEGRPLCTRATALPLPCSSRGGGLPLPPTAPSDSHRLRGRKVLRLRGADQRPAGTSLPTAPYDG